jgi:hypothetical protein
MILVRSGLQTRSAGEPVQNRKKPAGSAVFFNMLFFFLLKEKTKGRVLFVLKKKIKKEHTQALFLVLVFFNKFSLLKQKQNESFNPLIFNINPTRWKIE